MGLYGNTCRGVLHLSANGDGSQKGPRCSEALLLDSQSSERKDSDG